jgi:acyl phosphate:glycerol-3-phosphate acyltransferase
VLAAILLILAGYLIGAIPFGYLVARARGVDIRRQGSCNIGATNVGRVLGRKWGIVVFLLDFCKGALPVLAARLLPLELEWPPDTLAVSTGVAAFVGHVYPVYLGFQGGKGVATAAGVVAVLLPLALLGALLVWLAVVLATRYVSLASVAAAVFLAGQRLAFTPQPWNQEHLVVSLFCILAATLVVLRHHANLRRLWHGNENQLKENAAMLNLSKALHVLALGICLGTQVFFTIQGLVLVQTFKTLSEKGKDDRPTWYPLPNLYGKVVPKEVADILSSEPPEKRPADARLEQGSRAFGAVVSPLFVWYYGIQTGCVLLALACAWSWPRVEPGQRVHRGRLILLVVAVVLLGVGWWLDFVVHDLRGPRNDKTDIVLRSTAPSSTEIREAVEARRAFGLWHGYSLMQNFATMLVVAIALAQAARMPRTGPRNLPQGILSNL